MHVEFSDDSKQKLQNNNIDSGDLASKITTFLEGIFNPSGHAVQRWEYRGRFLDWKAQVSSQNKSIYRVEITKIV